MLSKPEIDCLLNGKEPTQAQVDAIAASLNPSNGVRLMSVRHHEPITNAMLVAVCMEELASQRQEIDELRGHLHQLLARVANKRLKLGK